MDNLLKDLIEELDSDIISYGDLVDLLTLHSLSESTAVDEMSFDSIITRLLSSGIEIGNALDEEGYTVFKAWTGDIPNRVERAIHLINNLDEDDRRYCFWLCLRNNVDEYETEAAQPKPHE